MPCFAIICYWLTNEKKHLKIDLVLVISMKLILDMDVSNMISNRSKLAFYLQRFGWYSGHMILI